MPLFGGKRIWERIGGRMEKGWKILFYLINEFFLKCENGV
jgi:hypothetical protein